MRIKYLMYICQTKQLKNTITMEKEIAKLKKIMNSLLACVQDKSISIQERNKYYSEYLQLSQNLLLLSK